MFTRGSAKVHARTQYKSMSPGQLVLALFEGAISAVVRAEAALEGGEARQRGEATSKALAIVGELQASLRLDAGEIAENLSLLYDYVSRELVRGNVREDEKAFADVRRILEQLRDAWSQMLASNRDAEAGAAAAAVGGPRYF